LGWLVGFFVSGMAFLFTLLTTFALDQAFFIGIVAYSATVLGSIIPDIDQSRPHKSFETGSIPYRGLVNVIRVGLIFGGFLVVVNSSNVDSTLGLVGILAGIVAGVYLFSKIPDILHSVMPKHRGLTHQILPWVVFAVLGTIFLRDLFIQLGATDFAISYFPPAIAPPLALGAMCHISLDIVVSFIKRV